MLDDLRSTANEPPRSPSEELQVLPEGEFKERKPLFGMSPAQRFVIALLLLVITCVLGTACLVIFGKINLPFF
jgi:hypothetical protein